MRNVSDEVVEKIKAHILCSITFLENRTVCEMMSKNIVDTEGPQMTSQYGAYAFRYWIGKATCTCAHAHRDQYVTLIAFPLQQRFRERTSSLRYKYVASFVTVNDVLEGNVLARGLRNCECTKIHLERNGSD